MDRTVDQITVKHIINMMDNSTMSEKECMVLLGISDERQEKLSAVFLVMQAARENLYCLHLS